MEVKLRELFGEEMREYGKHGGEINFLQVRHIRAI